MSSTKEMLEFRNRIDEVYRNFIGSVGNGTLSVDEVLKVVKEELSVEIAAVKSELVDLMLRRLVHDVGRRRDHTSSGTQEVDLFEGYKRIPQSVSIGGGNKKRTAKLTIVEVEAYLEEHSPKAVSERNQELRRVIEDCRRFQQLESDTLEVLMERRAKSEAAQSQTQWDG